MSPNDQSDIVPKIETILADAKKLDQDDAPAKLAIIRQLDSLYQDLEPPINLFFKQWTSLTVFTCLDIVIKLGLLEEMKDAESVSAEKLGKFVGIEAGVIARVMRPLVAARILAYIGEDTYSHTPRSRIFLKGERTAVDSFELLALLNKSFITIPNYLQTRPSSDLDDIRKTPYACAYGMEGKTFYETLSANPEHLGIFNRSMSGPGSEFGIFPFASLEEEVKADSNRPFVVDIGGGKGQALRYIKEATDDAFGTTGKLVLQERADVLEELSEQQKQGLELMAYDFHTEQPVKGAHVYHLCQILHNYPDHVCKDILKHVVMAMTPKSRLLIVDAVLPAQTEVGGDMSQYLIDFVGIAMGGKERTEKELVALLDSEGLQLVKVWHSKKSWQAVAEVRLKSG